MHCVITCGPTFEPLDEVRRLTNFSTGELGTRLAEYLLQRGHSVMLLKGASAVYPDSPTVKHIVRFTTSADLADKLRQAAADSAGAVFHAAAVGDFAFGKVYKQDTSDKLHEIKAGKISTSEAPYLVELVSTPKIIRHLREWYPNALLIGWKYEVDGNRDSCLEAACRQISGSRTDGCVANGPAYGSGFGLVAKDGSYLHLRDRDDLFASLERSLG